MSGMGGFENLFTVALLEQLGLTLLSTRSG